MDWANDMGFEEDEDERVEFEDQLYMSAVNENSHLSNSTGVETDAGDAIGQRIPCHFPALSQMLMSLLRCRFAFAGSREGTISILQAQRCVLMLGSPDGASMYAMDNEVDAEEEYQALQEEMRDHNSTEMFIREWGEDILRKTEQSNSSILESAATESDTFALQKEMYALIRHYWSECPLRRAEGDPLFHRLWSPIHQERRLREEYTEMLEAQDAQFRDPSAPISESVRLRMQQRLQFEQQDIAAMLVTTGQAQTRRAVAQSLRQEHPHDPYGFPDDRLYTIFRSLVRGDTSKNTNWRAWILKTLHASTRKCPRDACREMWQLYWHRVVKSMDQNEWTEPGGVKRMTEVNLPSILNSFRKDAEQSTYLLTPATIKRDASGKVLMTQNYAYWYGLTRIRASESDPALDDDVIHMINRKNFRRSHGIWIDLELNQIRDLWMSYIRNSYPMLEVTFRDFLTTPTVGYTQYRDPSRGGTYAEVKTQSCVAPLHLIVLSIVSGFMELTRPDPANRYAVMMPPEHASLAQVIVNRACCIVQLWLWLENATKWINVMTRDPGKRLATLHFTYGQEGWNLHHARNVVEPLRHELHRFVRGTTSGKFTPYAYPLSLTMLRALREELRPYVREYLAPTRQNSVPTMKECPQSFGSLPVRLSVERGGMYRRQLRPHERKIRDRQRRQGYTGVHTYEDCSSGGSSSSDHNGSNEVDSLRSIYELSPMERVGVILCSLPEPLLGFIALVNTNMQVRQGEVMVNHPYGVVPYRSLLKLAETEQAMQRQQNDNFYSASDGNLARIYGTSFSYFRTKSSTRVIRSKSAWERLFLDTQSRLASVPMTVSTTKTNLEANRNSEWLRLLLHAEDTLFGERICRTHENGKIKFTLAHLCQARDGVQTVYPAMRDDAHVRRLLGNDIDKIVPLGGKLYAQTTSDPLHGTMHSLRIVSSSSSSSSSTPKKHDDDDIMSLVSPAPAAPEPRRVYPQSVPGSNSEPPWKLLDTTSTSRVLAKIFQNNLNSGINELIMTLDPEKLTPLFKDVSQYMRIGLFITLPFWTRDSIFGDHLLTRAEQIDVRSTDVVRTSEMLSTLAWNHYLYQKNAPRVQMVPKAMADGLDIEGHLDDMWGTQVAQSCAHMEIAGELHEEVEKKKREEEAQEWVNIDLSNSTSSPDAPTTQMTRTERHRPLAMVLQMTNRGSAIHQCAEQLCQYDKQLNINKHCADVMGWYMYNFWNNRTLKIALRGVTKTGKTHELSRSDQTRQRFHKVKRKQLPPSHADDGEECVTITRAELERLMQRGSTTTAKKKKGKKKLKTPISSSLTLTTTRQKRPRGEVDIDLSEENDDKIKKKKRRKIVK